MAESSKLWSEGPHICNVDPKVMPHFSIHAKCNYCGEMIPFTVDVEREMRKHYNTKHRLYCNACKKGDFNSRAELDLHLAALHKDGVCFNCHASFKLASAVAMHVEGPRGGPRNECAVPPTPLVNALRHIQQTTATQNGVSADPITVYSPVSCCPGNEHTVQRLKDFRKSLLLAHERAFAEVQESEEIRNGQSADVVIDQGATPLILGNADARDCVEPSKPSSSATGLAGSSDTTDVEGMIALVSDRDDTLQSSSQLPMEWTCSTCVDAKFTSLSKLLQHVEQKVRNSWWMSVHH